MTTQHTPEPWTWGMLYITKHDPTNPRRDSSGYLQIAKHPTGEVQPEGGEWEANARRIVACVNACQIFNDPDAGVMGLLQDRAELSKQRDELAAALRECLPFIDDADDVATVFPESAASKVCRTTVAKTRALLAKLIA